ncbi:hypothetical protein AU468_00045 [Alkalispirochaeta sphaeroplastigenens]|uniref:Spermidine synthase n=1 Tax=Alkalispirochaeta sphaeroplastigenens TaxID=1187066 RepID=A0A2S4K1G3_9SPIO|nr:spermidine synthase-like protein [Alkalispirochaeta sphaeroplastigenens]POR05604.1 hypothetical protein AU468_00045 [Alkalispirochaeta sphaeroplastigenens]
MSGPNNSRGSLPALALLSAGVIAFQLVIMRTLSAAQGAPFTGLVISAAMLGFGAAGSAAFLGKDLLFRHLFRNLISLFFLSAAAMAATTSLTGITERLDLFLLFSEPHQGILLAGVYLLYAVPFFFAGLAITLFFLQTPLQIGLLYAANLGGSAAGALLGLAALRLLPLASLPGLTALLPLAGGILLLPALPSQDSGNPSAPGHRSIPLPAATGILALILAGRALISPGLPEPSQYKDISAALQLPQARIIHSESTHRGHLTVVRAPALRYAPGISLQFPHEPPQWPVLFNDGDYFGTLPEDGTLPRQKRDRNLLDYTTRMLPYEVRSPRHVAILGGRTGTDAAHALARGARQVTVQESHSPALNLLRERHPEWIHHLYQDPRVSTTSLAIRPWIARHNQLNQDLTKAPLRESEPLREGEGKTYDLIVTPQLGQFGGTSGTGAMEPRYDYTREALGGIFRLLTPRGMISTTLWLEDPPSISLRLLATWIAVLEDEGVHRPSDHIAAIQSWNSATLLVSRTPFTGDEQQAVRRSAESLGFDLLILPDLKEDERERFHRRIDQGFHEALQGILEGEGLSGFGDYWFDVSPRSDSSPFFFQFLDPRAIPRIASSAGGAALPYFEIGFFTAILAAIQAVVAALVLIAAPLCGRSRWRSGGRIWTFLYFAGTGTGFIVAEIALIQETILPLGHHLEASATVLALLLTSSGAGSLLSRRVQPSSPVLAGAALATAALILARALPGRSLAAAALTASPAAGLAMIAAGIVPTGLVAGMVFPLGLRRLAGPGEDHLPWACAIDSSCSVAAAAVTTLLCARIGLSGAWIVSCGAYLGVALAALKLGVRGERG